MQEFNNESYFTFHIHNNTDMHKFKQLLNNCVSKISVFTDFAKHILGRIKIVLTSNIIFMLRAKNFSENRLRP